MKLIISCLLIFFSFSVYSQPNQISIQGSLSDSNGNKLNGTFTMTFNFYTAPAAQTPIYGFTPSQKVEVVNGLFSVIVDLGSGATIFKNNPELWLGVKVENESEFPRIKIVSSGYAIHSKYADNLTTKITDATISDFFENGSITSEQIKNGSITSEKIKEKTIMFYHLGDNGCQENQIIKFKNNQWVCSNDEGGISGTGTANHIVKFQNTSELADSVIVESGGNVGIGTDSPEEKFHVVGNIKATGKICDLNGCINSYGTGIGISRFNDDFSTSNIDSDRWTKTVLGDYISIENGKLKMIVPQTSNNWYGPHLASKAPLIGDFDVMIDVDSSTVPSGNDGILSQVRIKIKGMDGNYYVFTMGDRKESPPFFDAWTNAPSCESQYIKKSSTNYLPKTSYRIVRVGTSIFAFYKNANTNNQWKLFTQCTNGKDDIIGEAEASLAAYCSDDGNTSDKTTFFDNFKIARGIDPMIVNETIKINGFGEVGIGSSQPVAKLDVNGGVKIGSSNKECNSQTAGLLRYNSSLKILEYCNGTIWIKVGGSGKDGTTQQTASTSCKKILSDGYSTGSGIYWIDPDGDGDTSDAFQVYCDMETDGGGWTLIATISNSDGKNWSYENGFNAWLDNTSLVKSTPDLTSDYKSSAYGLLPALYLLIKTDKGAWATYSGIGGISFLSKLQSETTGCNSWSDSAAILSVIKSNASSLNKNLIINGVDGNWAGHCVFNNSDPSDSHVLAWLGTNENCTGQGLMGIGSGWETNIKASGWAVYCNSVNCWEDFTSDNQWKICSNPHPSPLSNNSFGEPLIVYLFVK